MSDFRGSKSAMTRRSVLGGAAALAGAGPACALTEKSQVPPDSFTKAIAEAVTALPERAPVEVEERVAWTLLDNLASMLYAGTLARPMSAAAYFAKNTPGRDADVLTADLVSSQTGAASAMAYLLHAAEIDDSDPRGELRASAVIMPACLAAAQAADASGPEFLRAAALGYTLQGRFVQPVGPVQTRGWMASGVWGPPAAAAAVSFLRGRPAADITSAMSLAGSAAGGAFQYYFDQTDEKRIIVARAARAAIESADLAALGEHGAARILEGRAGLYHLFAGTDAPALAQLTDDLGRLEGPLYLRPKFFAASHSIIPTLDGLQAAAPPELDPASIESFIVRGNASWSRIVARKINDFEPPSSRIGAALNFSFVVAMWLVRRSVLPGDYTQEAFRDPDIISLARSGSFEVNDSDHLSIEIVLRYGERIHAVAQDPDRNAPAPLSAAQRMNKFNALAGSRLNEERKADLHEHCMELKNARSMRAWVRHAQKLCGA